MPAEAELNGSDGRDGRDGSEIPFSRCIVAVRRERRGIKRRFSCERSSRSRPVVRACWWRDDPSASSYTTVSSIFFPLFKWESQRFRELPPSAARTATWSCIAPRKSVDKSTTLYGAPGIMGPAAENDSVDFSHSAGIGAHSRPSCSDSSSLSIPFASCNKQKVLVRF